MLLAAARSATRGHGMRARAAAVGCLAWMAVHALTHELLLPLIHDCGGPLVRVSLQHAGGARHVELRHCGASVNAREAAALQPVSSTHD